MKPMGFFIDQAGKEPSEFELKSLTKVANRMIKAPIPRAVTNSQRHCFEGSRPVGYSKGMRRTGKINNNQLQPPNHIARKRSRPN